MPISFRCPSCRHKLSTAKRKAGQAVSCPKCGGEVQVPSADTLDPRVEHLLATAGGRAAPPGDTTEPDDPTPASLPPPPPPPAPVARRPKPAAVSPPAKLNDLPLFEREDFAQMLEQDADAVEETPIPLPAEPPRPTAPADAFVVTRGTAILALVCVLLLVGLAFAAGLMVGGRG